MIHFEEVRVKERFHTLATSMTVPLRMWLIRSICSKVYMAWVLNLA